MIPASILIILLLALVAVGVVWLGFHLYEQGRTNRALVRGFDDLDAEVADLKRWKEQQSVVIAELRGRLDARPAQQARSGA